jgi:hypothetical protein
MGRRERRTVMTQRRLLKDADPDGWAPLPAYLGSRTAGPPSGAEVERGERPVRGERNVVLRQAVRDALLAFCGTVPKKTPAKAPRRGKRSRRNPLTSVAILLAQPPGSSGALEKLRWTSEPRLSAIESGRTGDDLRGIR